MSIDPATETERENERETPANLCAAPHAPPNLDLRHRGHLADPPQKPLPGGNQNRRRETESGATPNAEPASLAPVTLDRTDAAIDPALAALAAVPDGRATDGRARLRRASAPAPAQPELTLKAWTALGGGLYRYNKTGGYYHRPVINGRPTFRSLDTTQEKTARHLLSQTQIASEKARAGAGPDPYARKILTTTGQIIQRYLDDGCPDRHREPRPLAARKKQQRFAGALLTHWSAIAVQDVTLAELDRYFDLRRKQIARGPGHCTVDKEIETLNSAFTWAVRCAMVKYNPLVGQRVKYAQGKNTKHCRDYMPADADALHTVARWLFVNKKHSRVCGWQYLLEAFTGLRTGEALRLRIDARPGQPGHVIIDPATGAWKLLEVGRSKNGCNPFIEITPEKQTLLEALLLWQRTRYPRSHWYFPALHGKGQNHLCPSALSYNLCRASRHFGQRYTSHGARAYYVTARRSWGISDVQIAIEIGHRGGANLISTTYGAVPQNWLAGDGPKMTWLPADAPPAWDVLNLPSQSNIVQLPSQKTA
jgi:integrase